MGFIYFFAGWVGGGGGVVAVVCVCVCGRGFVGCCAFCMCFYRGTASNVFAFTHRSVEMFNLLHLPAEYIPVFKFIFIIMNVIYFN